VVIETEKGIGKGVVIEIGTGKGTGTRTGTGKETGGDAARRQRGGTRPGLRLRRTVNVRQMAKRKKIELLPLLMIVESILDPYRPKF
jgi:hypothetical protein